MSDRTSRRSRSASRQSRLPTPGERSSAAATRRAMRSRALASTAGLRRTSFRRGSSSLAATRDQLLPLALRRREKVGAQALAQSGQVGEVTGDGGPQRLGLRSSARAGGQALRQPLAAGPEVVANRDAEETDEEGDEEQEVYSRPGHHAGRPRTFSVTMRASAAASSRSPRRTRATSSATRAWTSASVRWASAL